jgi:hypothetical protein
MWGSRGIVPAVVTSTLDEGQWSASRSRRFTPRERAPGTHWIERCVGPKADLTAVKKRTILHWRESNPGRYTGSFVYLIDLTFRRNVSLPSSRYNTVQNFGYDVYCVQNILDGAGSSDSDAIVTLSSENCYVPYRTQRWLLNSLYPKSCWTDWVFLPQISSN